MASRPQRSSFRAGLDRIVSNVASASAALSSSSSSSPSSLPQRESREQQLNTAVASSASCRPPNDDVSAHYYAIRVVDAETKRGIPLVFVRTTFKAVYMTDSAGYVAFNEPGLMTGEPLWVTLSSYGYGSPIGFLGVAGLQIHPKPGGSVELQLQRTQIATRLYRMTGYGIYRDSVLLGKPTPLAKPLVNGKVAGCDTVQCVRFQGKLLWMWQDTERFSFGLGNFAMTGATTDLAERLDPDQGLDFAYFTEKDNPDEFVRPMVSMKLDKPGSFPIWVDGLTAVPDATGTERLVARYYAAGHSMERIEEGLVLWDDKKKVLEKLKKFDKPERALAPGGHAVFVVDCGVRYAYYGRNVRVKADFASVCDPREYEAFTCVTPDGKKAVRGRDGSLRWHWEKGGRPVNHETAEALVSAGILRAQEAPYRLCDVDSGKRVGAAHVGIAWNPYLKLWVNIIQQKLGDTTAGEIWVATARAPEGPWEACRKVATHHMARDGYACNHNDLYNPVQHYELMDAVAGRSEGEGEGSERGPGPGPGPGESNTERGRMVYFSGTLVNTFSGNPWWTPGGYNYNNIMYRLDLAEERLVAGLKEPGPGLWRTKPDE
ncbi:hypothetical protein BD289DRAFT_446096 [Coniella lustricola]|uniref:Uncharacterized protein n=1 Tax=Coniella lustricola TaxID=2025994 RepID=A0A2T2ZUA7_9PEZI|nr:hypothetical protein BD289DRAFT_446096 [Coniella lustricola]